MDEAFAYILELLEADEISPEKFVADARWLAYDDFDIAMCLVDHHWQEVSRIPNANTTLWHRQFDGEFAFGSRCTAECETKTLAFDAALEIVAGCFGLTLPPGSGRCRQVVAA